MNQVRIAVLNGFSDLVRDHGGDPARVLERSGLPASFFEDRTSDDLISYEQVERLLQTAADMTGCFYFAVLLGSKQDINLLGIIGHVMQHSTDVKTALLELNKHFSLHVKDASTIELETVGENAALTYKVTGDLKVVRQSNELAMSESMMVLRAVCGTHWKPSAVKFTHKTPVNIIPYRRIFGAPAYFNQDETQILFPKEFLNQPILRADPELSKILHKHIELLEKDSSNNLCIQVETLIRRTLPTGKCSIENIASLMSVHRRTLHRMLKDQGVSFTELLENVRKSIAAERLQSSDLTIIQLADYLGYSDNSAFTRSFKRWYGLTPQQWRKLNR